MAACAPSLLGRPGGRLGGSRAGRLLRDRRRLSGIGLAGKGDGIIVQRGFPAPPSYHSDALRQASAQHIFDTISNGHGVMYSFAARIEPHDRWAIVAYVRALQEAQNARVAELPDARSHLP